MIKKIFSLLLLIGFVFYLLIPAVSGAALAAPQGFQRVEEAPGVALYRRDAGDGAPDYVLVVNLASGASVDPLHGRPQGNDGKKSRGMYEGTNPAFGYRTIHGYWEAYTQAQPGAFCVTNGQFFYMPENPTPLALPLKVDGEVVAEGFGFPQYPEKQLMLALWPGRADILPLTHENLYNTTAPDAIGGLTEEANKKPKNAVGRTFVGIWDSDGDGGFETLAILTAGAATQKEAAKTLYSFGAAKVMMLDGGGSTQLVCGGQAYRYTERALPQALGVSAAPPGGLDAASLLAGAAASQPAPEPVEGVAVVVPSGTAQEAGGGELAANGTGLADSHGSFDATDASAAAGQAQAPVEGVAVVVPSGTAAEAGGGEFATGGTDQADLHGSSIEGDSEAGGGRIDIAGGESGGELLGSSMAASPSVEAASTEGDAGQAQAPVEGVAVVVGPGTAAQELAQQPAMADALPPGGPDQNPDSSSAGQSGEINPSDLLILPAVISPVSFFILLFSRRRNVR